MKILEQMLDTTQSREFNTIEIFAVETTVSRDETNIYLGISWAYSDNAPNPFEKQTIIMDYEIPEINFLETDKISHIGEIELEDKLNLYNDSATTTLYDQYGILNHQHSKGEESINYASEQFMLPYEKQINVYNLINFTTSNTIIDIINIDYVMYYAIENKDEILIKEIILKAMAFFLENEEYTKENLDNVASLFFLVPIQLGWKDNLDLKDRKLHYVLQKLVAIKFENSKRAKEIVQQCKLYLEDKEYEILYYELEEHFL